MEAHMIQLTSVYYAVWYFVHSCWRSDQIGDLLRLCAGLYALAFIKLGHGEHLFFLKKMWDNLRHGELQEHLAPSGYLKIPTVSITRNAPFMLFGWHATLLLLWMYFWVVYCTGQSTGTAYFTGLSKHIYRPNCSRGDSRITWCFTNQLQCTIDDAYKGFIVLNN